MTTANINDRSSIEAIYPKAAFDHDAARNSRGKETIAYGLKILSEPDSEGAIDIATASQHVGESASDRDSIFLAAYRAGASAASDGNAYENSVAPTAENADDGDEYVRFIDRVLEAARAADFQSAIGRGEERLKGFHGG